VLAVTISTDTPLVNMGVTTMKIISSTNMMSAMGITFGDDICAPTVGLYAMAGYFLAPRRRMK
jgi:hypothetical protein